MSQTAALLTGHEVTAAEPLSSFKPGELWPDNHGVHINAHGGGFLLHEGVTYWYGEHKTAGEAGNCAEVGINCYSSVDLYNWKNEGIALAVSAGVGHPLERGCILERPKVLFNAGTGKFVMWVHLEEKGNNYASAMVAVAVADAPTGPFTFVRAFRPDGEMSRDMTLYLDDDGAAYQIRASEGNATLHISQLSEDFLETTGRFSRHFIDTYLEAPAVIKHQGRYHLLGSYCSGWLPNALRHAVADDIAGPWKELTNPCRGPANGLTFRSQPTYILSPEGSDTLIYAGDRWRPENAIDGRYVWLPLKLDGDWAELRWRDEWKL